MSIWSSFSSFVQATFAKGEQVVTTAGKTIDLATLHVDSYAAKAAITVQVQTQADTARELEKVQAELDADENLRTIYDSLDGMFNADFAYKPKARAKGKK